MRSLNRRVLLFVTVSWCVLLAAAGSAMAEKTGQQAEPADSASAKVSAAPLNPAFLESLAGPAIESPASAAVGKPLGGRPGPQDLSHTAGMQVPQAPGSRNGVLPATYDLRTLGRVTSVKNQNPYGTCWSFAACGSVESGLLPGETQDFSEDNMVLTSGFNYPGTLYNAGGHIWMSTAYLARWGGPVYESDDAYGDNSTPPGLTPRKHVQEVNWIPPRSSATNNDTIKNAVMTYGAADVAMGWYGDSSGSLYYNPTTASYYYNVDSDTNHEVLIVGWNDSYAASNFATTPPGNGAFLVKNSWGTGWGSSGYFWASYYDTAFGRGGNPFAVFNDTESTSNYSGIYQYDPLGNVTEVGLSSSTGWFANVFTAQSTASLSAVGFYTVVPGASYEVYTGSSLATKTLSTSGTLPYMGYHTVTLPTPVGVTSGQTFIVAVKMTSPGYNWPIAVEYPVANYSSGATAAAGQSYVSSAGSSWSDLTQIWNSNANVCLKAYVTGGTPPPPVAPTVTAPNGGESWTVGTSQSITWSMGNGGNVSIELSRNNGSTWETLFASTANDGTQLWTVSGAATSQAKVRIANANGADSSDASFAITAPPPPPTDTTPPATTLLGHTATGWVNHDVTFTLQAGDDSSGVAKIEYQLGAGAWTTYGAPVTVSAEGETLVGYRAVDNAGNTEAAKTATVRIDKTGPATTASNKLSVKKNKKATFRFKVADRTATAKVTIKIYKGKKLKKSLAVGSKACGSPQSYAWRKCTLAKGKYTWKVYATDEAGNKQVKIGAKTLVVK